MGKRTSVYQEEEEVDKKEATLTKRLPGRRGARETRGGRSGTHRGRKRRLLVMQLESQPALQLTTTIDYIILFVRVINPVSLRQPLSAASGI